MDNPKKTVVMRIILILCCAYFVLGIGTMFLAIYYSTTANYEVSLYLITHSPSDKITALNTIAAMDRLSQVIGYTIWGVLAIFIPLVLPDEKE